MTDKKITKIQRRNASLPVMALLSLVMTGASVFCIAFPYVKKFDELLFYCFTGVGVIGPAVFLVHVCKHDIPHNNPAERACHG